MHRDSLGKVWNSLAPEDFYQVFVHVDSDGTGTVRVSPSLEILSECTFELGECLYNLRAALDGSVYEAAVLQSGQDPPPNENSLEFPICFGEPEFRKSARKIAPLSQDCRSFIELMQPYNTPKALKPELLIGSFNRSLGILNSWARKDRHRRLHVIGSWASQINPMIRFPPGVKVKSFQAVTHGFLKYETEVATFALEGYVLGMKVDANPNFAFDIAVDEPPLPAASNDTLGERLRSMLATVGVCIDTLEDIVDGKIVMKPGSHV